MKPTITVEAIINADIEKVWEAWNNPTDIEAWMHAGDDWECSKAINDLTPGGHFTYTLGAIDKSEGFDVSGVYTVVEPHSLIAYTLDDDRAVITNFTPTSEGVKVSTTFEMENENSEEIQRSGWQATLENFKKHVDKK